MLYNVNSALWPLIKIINSENYRSAALQLVISIREGGLELKAEEDRLPIQLRDFRATHADIARARTKLGFGPLTPIDVGIPRFV